jgi:hypothetical protein
MGGTLRATRSGLALALALACAPALAQSVSDFKLPGATASPSPERVQGPVDNDNPVIRGPRPSPTPAPSVAAEPIPASASPAATQPSQGAAAQQRARVVRQDARTARPQAAPPVQAPSVVPTPASPTASPLPTSSGTAPESGLAGAVPASTAAAPADSPALPDWWPWAAGGAGLAVTGLWALLALRRRRARLDEVDFEPPMVTEPEPLIEPAEPAPVLAAPAPAFAAATTPKPAPAPAPAATVAPATGTGDLEISLEARRMSASLMATTLSYRLVLTNRTKQHLTALAIEGDMVSAHASLPPDQQIASDSLRLELRHALVELAPGESAEFTGDFRLPLSAVTPIRAGEAAYFVPLARIRVEAAAPAGQPLVRVQTFVVGELPEPEGAALRPFRLDLGPRTYSRVGQRAVS